MVLARLASFRPPRLCSPPLRPRASRAGGGALLALSTLPAHPPLPMNPLAACLDAAADAATAAAAAGSAGEARQGDQGAWSHRPDWPGLAGPRRVPRRPLALDCPQRQGADPRGCATLFPPPRDGRPAAPPRSSPLPGSNRASPPPLPPTSHRRPLSSPSSPPHLPIYSPPLPNCRRTHLLSSTPHIHRLRRHPHAARVGARGEEAALEWRLRSGRWRCCGPLGRGAKEGAFGQGLAGPCVGGSRGAA